ncbi:Alcohol dehydrogenase class-3 [Zancudomyces culisetae]|uniref:Alcohol dehydrogenase class-3 n=1 Tax=Zancudomyces culisetae TaxID=1213189 RepID=A0A1R1PXW4_ZANCU|nr:Alcohol dehydrogenase class-3 [Zancudomyces culisetae]|eukprot:OMH85800.1 Alcohol dehydrogenase class-3 [Zancudomyces culisetae]
MTVTTTEGKVIKCKAAVAYGPKQDMVIEEIEVAPPKAGEIRVKILYAGICQSDAYILAGKDGGTNQYPLILGHESSGIVESVGEGVTEFAPGDYVIPLFMPQCKECKLCKSGRTNLCFKTSQYFTSNQHDDGTSRFSINGKPVGLFLGVSAFSQYTVVSQASLTKIRPNDKMNRICLLGCCVPTGYGAAVNTADIKKGDTVAVFGLGALGLSVIQGAAAAGASRIAAIDINPGKFDKAKEFGATDFYNPNDHKDIGIVNVIRQQFGGGVDCSFDTSGGGISVMNDAFECTMPGWGTSVIVSIAPAGEKISTDPKSLNFGKKWTGCMFGDVKGSDLDSYVEKYLDGKLMLDEYCTHHLPLSEINKGFQLLRDGESIRTIISMFD